MRMETRIQRLLGAIVMVATCSASGLAQDGGGKTKFTSLLNVDALVDNYARFLARKYNLNEEQEAFATKLMHEKASTFLSPRRDELFGLVDRMFDVRTGGAMDQGELQSWGKAVGPMYEEAKRLIIDGNNQFRTILNEEQRAIHDQDLKMMEESFAQTDDQLRRIQSGEMTVDEFRNPPRPGQKKSDTPPPPPPTPVVSPAPTPVVTPAPSPGISGKGEAKPVVVAGPANVPVNKGAEPRPGPGVNPPPSGPVTPPPPPKGGGPTPPPPTAQHVPPQGRQFEGEWDQYTRQFIERYKLDSEQTAKAETILKDCKEQGERHVKSKDAQIKALEEREAKLREGTQDPAKQKEAQQVQKDKAKLFEPLGLIFEKQLKPRLEKLPTAKQRKEADVRPATPPKAPRPGSATPSSGRPGGTPPGKPNQATPTPPPPTPIPVTPTPAPVAPPTEQPQPEPQRPPPAPPTPVTEDGKPSKPDE